MTNPTLHFSFQNLVTTLEIPKYSSNFVTYTFNPADYEKTCTETL